VPVLGVVLLLAVVVGALAAAFPPEYAHYAGQDASLYVNNALKDELDQPPASSFFPPEVATEDLDARQVGEAFTDGKFLDDGSGGLGRMTPFVPVSSAFEVRMIYDLLVSDVSSAALWAGAGQRDIGYINYALLFGTAVLVFLLGRELTGRNAASAAGALVITVIPSMVEGARLTMGEALATFLWLLLVYLVTRSRGRDQWAFLLLIPLCATRAEFLVVLAALAAWAGWRRSRSLVLGLAAVGCVVVEPTISLLNFFPPLAEYDVSTAILVVGPYLAGLLGRLAYDRWSPFGPTRDAPMPEQPSTRALQVFWAVAIGGFFAAEGIRRLLDEGQSVGPIRWQRFSTLDLLGSSLGWFTLVVGVIGLIAGSRLLIAKIPPVLAVMTAPMLFVFLWMSAFTPNEFLWTRRFHLLVYPALALGVTLALDALLRDRRLDRWGVPAAAVVGVLAILAPALGLRDLDRSLLSWENVSDFHASAQQIPDGSIVLLDTSGGALKAQLPMRTVDGLWTYIVWEPEPAQDLVPVLQATGRPVLAASSVVDELGLDTTGEVITLEVPVSDAEAYAVPLEVVASQQV
jgi:hypothetical protein